MAFQTDIYKKLYTFNSLSDNAFLVCAIVLFTLVILAMLYASSLFMNNGSATYNTGRFFSMAKVIVSGATPYLDYQYPKPPLIFFTLAIPLLLGQQFLGGLLLIGLCNLFSSIVVYKIAAKLYSREAGCSPGCCSW
jgi:Na+/H+-translocating membrane pyrophosphatase